MTRADLEAAAEEKYPDSWAGYTHIRRSFERAAYVQGRLDQAEEDARIAEGQRPEMGLQINVNEYRRGKDDALVLLAAAIRKGVE